MSKYVHGRRRGSEAGLVDKCVVGLIIFAAGLLIGSFLAILVIDRMVNDELRRQGIIVSVNPSYVYMGASDVVTQSDLQPSFGAEMLQGSDNGRR